jgi:hypothetical protein
MRTRTAALVLAAGLAFGLAGCDRGATSNPNAPGRPGTGNPVTSVAPAAADTPPSRANAVAGSADQPAAAGAQTVPGASGNGGGQAAAQPGQGLQGGMGAGPAGSGPAGTPTSSAPTGASLPDGSRGTTYRSAGKN